MFHIFRMKHKPLTDPESAAMHEELDRREAAFEAAVAEMFRPRLTTEEILDQFVSAVTR